MHPRRAIRNAIATKIEQGGTMAADRVWANRVAPVDVETVLIEDGPVTLVYVRSDHIKPEDYPISGQEGLVKRTLEVCVEGTAVGAQAVDDKLDDMAEEIEELLEGFDIPGFPAAELRLMSTEIDVETALQQPVGGILLTYQCHYWKVWRPDLDEADDYCGGTLSVVPYMGGVQTGPAEVIPGCDDCQDDAP